MKTYRSRIINKYIYSEGKNLLSRHKILLIIQPNESNKKESLNKLIYSFEELPKILKYLNEKKENIPKFIYNNINNIHEILYNSNEVINLDSFSFQQNLTNYFYLSLILMYNPEIVNFTYSFEFINKNSLIRDREEKKYKKILISKINLDIIKNYEGLDDYDEDETYEELNKIKTDNINSIEENVNIFKEIKLEIKSYNIINQKIDNLYSIIIISLIKSKKIDDYQYAYNIIEELELEHIYLTKTILEKLSEELNSNEEYIKSYKIINKDDLFDERKINFYYILLKYIIKDSIYMYQFTFILYTRKLILVLLKSNELSFGENNININIKEKLDFIMQTLVDSEYYLKIPKHDLMKLEEILKYYKTFLFESKIENINIIEDIIKDNKLNYKIYLKDYDIAKNMNIRLPFIKNFYNRINNNSFKTEKDFNNALDNCNKIEQMLRDKKLKKIRKEDKELFKHHINDINNIELLLKIFNQETIDFYIKEFKNCYEKDKNNKKDIKEISLNINAPIINNKNNTNHIFYQASNDENNSNKGNSEKRKYRCKINKL